MGQAAREVGGYRAIEKIGEGGMATVYRGVQVSLERPVAIKVLSRRLSEDPELLERFQRESLIIARLAHPNIIHVIDRGVTRSGQPYFVMEYVQGTDLAALIRAGGLTLNRKLDVVIQVCKALSYAHKNGVVHRDVKPANVLIDAEGNARVLDFGIAQFLDDTGDAERTRAGQVMGTYAYMAPEQLADARGATAASDLYSLGVLLYELLTGTKPAGRFEPPRELDPSLPAALDELVLQCLERDPARRPASAEEVKNRLLSLLQGAHLGGDQRERADRGIGSVGDRFALLDVIRETPYGAVYLYENKADHSLIVVKRRGRTSSGLAEAKLLTRLKHPNLVNVLGASGNQQLFIVVMEYLSGGSLKDRLVGSIPRHEVLRIGRQVCAGLAFAHRNRIVHGNLRPSNILFTAADEVKVTDLGLDEHGGPDGQGNWYGVTGEPRSPQSDVYAAGVVFYQMLTGTLPVWEGESLVPSHAFVCVPREVRTLVERMMCRDRAERFGSLEPVINEIDRLLAADARLQQIAAAANDATVVATGEGGEETAVPETPAPKARHRWGRGLVLGALLVAAGAVAFSYYAGPDAVDRVAAAVGVAWAAVRDAALRWISR